MSYVFAIIGCSKLLLLRTTESAAEIAGTFKVTLVMAMLSATGKIMSGVVQFGEMVELGAKLKILQGGFTLQMYHYKYRGLIHCGLFFVATFFFSFLFGAAMAVAGTYPNFANNLSKIDDAQGDDQTKGQLTALLLADPLEKLIVCNDIFATALILVGVLQLTVFCWIRLMLYQSKWVNFNEQKHGLTVLFLTCMFAFPLRGAVSLCLRFVVAIDSDTDQEQLVESLCVKALFYGILFSIMDLPNIVYSYTAHYKNFGQKGNLRRVSAEYTVSRSLLTSRLDMSDDVSVDEDESSYAQRMMSKLTLYGGLIDDPILGHGHFSDP